MPHMGGGRQIVNSLQNLALCAPDTKLQHGRTAANSNEMAAPSVPMTKWFVPARNGDSFIQS